MAEVILMPRLSDTMTEGVIAAWHKKVGDTVKKGDLLAEVETDKATMELESYKDGTLLHIGSDKGGKLQVNDLLAIIGAPGEDVSGLVKGGSAPAAETKKEVPAPAKEEKKATPPKEAAAPAAGMDLTKVDEVILMPRLSDTMTEGVIAAWHKKVGDAVKKGDLLADVETDKATMELESYKNGKLLYIGAQKGDKVPVNALLCIIGEEGKVDVDKIVAAAKGGTAATAAAEAPAENKVSSNGVAAASSTAPAKETAASTLSVDASGRIKASPLAKKLAAEKGINIAQVQGTGDGGRIPKSDIDNYKPAAAATETKQTASFFLLPAVHPAGQPSFDEVPVTQMRKAIAKSLSGSLFTAPHFYVTMAIDMDKAVESRAKLNEVSKVKISFNDMVLKACAIALKQHPSYQQQLAGR